MGGHSHAEGGYGATRFGQRLHWDAARDVSDESEGANQRQERDEASLLDMLSSFGKTPGLCQGAVPCGPCVLSGILEVPKFLQTSLDLFRLDHTFQVGASSFFSH